MIIKMLGKNLILIYFTFVVSGNFISLNGLNESNSIDKQKPDHEIKFEKIDRAKKLEAFLESKNSPLAKNVDTFIFVADKYGMDYRLLPAISCIESSCGQRLIPNSYNPFGWGVYGNSYISFNNYDQAIEKVGAGIYSGYIERGADTVDKMAPIYTPPNYIKWSYAVKKFMTQIDNS